ncbi:MAG: hypothetical protein M3Y24_08600 [Acidobacteriota bacterium]|nr:hypothetical protein [Acidobacteriota bacterium]
MDHFSSEDWIDYVRGVSPSKAALMETHLRQGCAECLRSSEVWGFVLSFSAKETHNAPPDDAVRVIKAAYVPARPERWLPEIAQFARLVLDTLKQPYSAAVRDSLPSSRLLLHEAEPFTIDLRLDTDLFRKRISLMGQILNSKEPEQSSQRIDVILLNGERLVKKTRANYAGEFDLEFGAEDNLQLFINIQGQRAIGIVLPDMNKQDGEG